jgi:hypothetical protein
VNLARSFKAGNEASPPFRVASATIELQPHGDSTVADATPDHGTASFPPLKDRAKLSLPLRGDFELPENLLYNDERNAIEASGSMKDS